MSPKRQASVAFEMPPWMEPPAGSTREQIIAWAAEAYREYPDYLALLLEGGALMGDSLQAAMFDMPAATSPAPRTLGQRQRQQIAAGRHPLMGTQLDPDPAHTCGGCGNLRYDIHGFRGYWKCRLHASHSQATDVRKWWPGCTGWIPR